MTAALTSFSVGQPVAGQYKWFKGNTHTHTKNSDGDSLPETVVKWYSDNGYNFLFITDHEFITPAAPLNQQFGKEGSFIVMQAQEITDRVDKKPYHTNALGISSVIKPTLGKTVVESVQQNIDNVRAAGGVPQINHPNFGWALTAEQILKLKNVNLMEIHNGHPLVNNIGGGGQPGAEEIWDALLSNGKLIYGIGSDDAHHFIRFDDRKLATPGHAWVVVRAESLTAAAILKSLDTGDFYASTGVELKDYQADSRSITIDIREKTNSKYTVQFIGRDGKVLKTEIANPAIYKIRGNEGYVRAKIIESNGTYAWTQPVMLKKK